jgi:hypothetical protein
MALRLTSAKEKQIRYRPPSPVFYTQKSFLLCLSQGGQQQSFTEYKQNTIPIAQSQVADRRIASAVQVTAKPADQGDRFTQVPRWL